MPRVEEARRKGPLFPAWVDKLNRIVVALLIGGLIYLVVLIASATAPATQMTGYRPTQPVPYSHALHAGELGIDCRYCHTGVEVGASATLPATEICMNCHSTIRADSDKLLLVRESYATGLPIEWVRVHDLPDFVYFNHSAHARRGVGCVSCHGRVDKMDEGGVYQAEPLNMGWCLACHREPEPHLRPIEQITSMEWQPADQDELGRHLAEEYSIHPSIDCSTCHR